MEDESRLFPWVAAEARINRILIHVEQYFLMLTALLTGFDEIDSNEMERAQIKRRWLRTYLEHTSVFSFSPDQLRSSQALQIDFYTLIKNDLAQLINLRLGFEHILTRIYIIAEHFSYFGSLCRETPTVYIHHFFRSSIKSDLGYILSPISPPFSLPAQLGLPYPPLLRLPREIFGIIVSYLVQPVLDHVISELYGTNTIIYLQNPFSVIRGKSATMAILRLAATCQTMYWQANRMTQTWSQLLYRMTPGLVNTERYYSDIRRAVLQKQRLSDLNTATRSPPSPLLIRYELNHYHDVEDGGRERLYETFGVVVDDLPRTRDLRLLLATETLLLHALEFLPATQKCLKTLALGVEFVDAYTNDTPLHTMPFNIIPFQHLVNNLQVLHLTLSLDTIIDLITAHEQWTNVTTFTLHVVIISMDERRYYERSSIIPTVSWGPEPLSLPTLSQCRFPALNRFEISSHGSFHEHHFIGSAHLYLPQFIEWLGLRACPQLSAYVAYGQILVVPDDQSLWDVGDPRAWETHEHWLSIASVWADDPSTITGLLGTHEDQNWLVRHIK